MKFFYFLLPMLAFCQIGCTQNQNTSTEIHFGEKIDEIGAVSLAATIEQMDQSEEVNTKVIGRIEKVCKKKGCWVTLKDDGVNETVFVKFKDYGFFMPLDCENRKVVMEGKAFKEVTPVDELRHYAEDAGKSEQEIAAITEPKVEYKFLANGVKFLN